MTDSNDRARAVWIVNEGGHDYDNAKKYGHLISLTQGTVNPFRTDRLADHIAQRLKGATKDDYVLLSGSPILNGLTMSLWLFKFPRCNTLQWSTMFEDYDLKTIKRSALKKLLAKHA